MGDTASHPLKPSHQNYSGPTSSPRVCYDETARGWRVYVDTPAHTKQSISTFDSVREATTAWMETQLGWEKA